MLEFQILECRSRTQTASQQNALFGGKLHSSELEVLTCPVGVFVASLVRTLQRYVHSPRYAITSQFGGDLGCGVVGVFHDFLEPALLSGWPVFQLIHFFTSIVRLNDGFEEPQLLTIYLSEPDRCRIGCVRRGEATTLCDYYGLSPCPADELRATLRRARRLGRQGVSRRV